MLWVDSLCEELSSILRLAGAQLKVELDRHLVAE